MTDRRAFSVATFARHRGRVLLIHHARLKTWLPVGGEIEAGETPLEAAARELKEETGLVGRFDAGAGGDAGLARVTGTPPGLIAFEEHPAGSKGLHLNFCFVADVDHDRVVANDEFGAHRWVSAKEMAVRDGAAAIDCPPNVRELVAIALHGAAGGATNGGTGRATGAATTNDRLVALAREWLAAFNERALERLLSLYADDAAHFSPKLLARRPETKGLVHGKSALRDWWADCFARLPGLHYAERAISIAAAPPAPDAASGRILLEYERTVPGEAPLAVAECFVVRDGRIAESRVYHG